MEGLLFGFHPSCESLISDLCSIRYVGSSSSRFHVPAGRFPGAQKLLYNVSAARKHYFTNSLCPGLRLPLQGTGLEFQIKV